MSSPLPTRKHDHFLAKVWALTKPYWQSEEKWSAWGFLALILALTLGSVYLTVLLNRWSGEFYNAIQNKDLDAFWHLIGEFSILATIYIIAAVYQYYVTSILQIRWRRWLTNVYFDRWLDGHAYYLMEMRHDESDNPDQRISEDIDRFTDATLNLTIGLLRSIVSLISFSVILWTLSQAVAFDIGPLHVDIPGFMLWAALLYAGIGSLLTHYVGRRLIRLNFTQQRYEADFRFSMARLRENAERVALYGAEDTEKGLLRARFDMVWQNFWRIMRTQKRLIGFTSAYGQIAIIFPLLIAAPAYFGGAMQLGGLMRVVSAFGRVQDALSWFVDNYASLAAWRSVVDRLTTMNENMENLVPPRERDGQHYAQEKTDHLTLHQVALRVPDGTTLLRIERLAFNAGEHTLIHAPSGSGKSVLFRTLAGIWPWWSGSVKAGSSQLFLPQTPYLPIGTLRDVLSYPDQHSDHDDDALKTLLRQCRLEKLEDQLHSERHWAHLLSPGEQQRLAFARALLKQPDWLFLDESSSALDLDTEQHLYTLLKQQLPHTTLISIAHRTSLNAFHDRVIDLRDISA